MRQILLTFSDDTKIDLFLNFVKDLDYVAEANLVPTEAVPPPHGDYAIEDIRAIAARFPADYVWQATDLEKYFPKDLKVSVQIIQNQLFIMAAPNDFHQALLLELSTSMHLFAKTSKIGKIRFAPLDVKIDENNVLQPDIIFVSLTRLDIMQENGIMGAPDLVVEIWSPANKKKERNLKHEIYEQNGVKEYWQIYPKKKRITIEALNQEGKYEIVSDVKNKGVVHSQILAGFAIDIEELWANCGQ